MNKRSRILFEFLVTPLVLLVPVFIYCVVIGVMGNLEESLSLAKMMGWGYLLSLAPTAAFTVILEIGFMRLVRPNSWSACAFSTIVGFVVGLVSSIVLIKFVKASGHYETWLLAGAFFGTYGGFGTSLSMRWFSRGHRKKSAVIIDERPAQH